MIIDIQSLGFPITSALANYARRRLRFVLVRRSDRIQRVVVRLGDENGPRGGVDKYCRIQVRLFDAPVAVIEEVGSELYAVIDRATSRVGRVVVKHLDRLRSGRRDGRGGAVAPAPFEAAEGPDPKHRKDKEPEA